jgi:hypothetical protein
MEIGRSGSVRSRLSSRGSLAFHTSRLGSVLLVNSLNLSSV